MRFHRPLLYAGVFLIAIGGVGFAADAGAVDTTVLTGIVRLWPLAVIAIGLALVLRRTPFGLVGGIAAAAVPGLLLGSSFAVLPRITEHCGPAAPAADVGTQSGVFGAPALVSIETSCGSLALNTAAGSGWQVHAANTGGVAPSVVANADTLSVSPGDSRWDFVSGGRSDWTVTLPTQQLGAVSLEVNTGRASVNLAGATLESLAVDADLADVTVDLTGSRIGQLLTTVDFGHASLTLPPGSDIAVRLEADAGTIDLCVPPDAGLHVSTRGSPRGFTFEGVRQSGGDWLGPRYDTAAYRFDIVVSASLGSIDINPIGGCR